MQVHHSSQAVGDWADGNPVHDVLGAAKHDQMVKSEVDDHAKAHTSEATSTSEVRPSRGEESSTSDDEKLEWDGTSWMPHQVSPKYVEDQPEPVPPQDPWVHDNPDAREYKYPDDCSLPQHPGQKPIPHAFQPVEVSSVDLAPYLKLGMVDIPVKVCLA